MMRRVGSNHRGKKATANFCKRGVHANDNRKDNLLKTEMCRSVQTRKECGYGAGCKYAHHADELRLVTLREKEGSILALWGSFSNTNLYRTLPCYDHVSTGNCPYGARCHSLHDPRVTANTNNTPLTCKEFPDSNLDTDIHVDYRYKTKQSEVHNGGPFGASTAEMLASFDAFISSICDQKNGAATSTGSMTKAQRLQIALKFDEDRKAIIKDCFNFKASHKISGIYPCMEVQAKVFDVRDGKQAVEIHKALPQALAAKGMSMPPGFITVREIAFGQEVDSHKNSDLHPALWFNIPDSDIQPATVEQIKRLNSENFHGSFLSYYSGKSPHDPQFPIFYTGKGGYCSMDNFITEVMRFELSALQGSNDPQQKISLSHRFESIKCTLEADKWPRSKGSNRKLDDRVPSEKSKYVPTKNKNIWSTFTSFTEKPSKKNAWTTSEDTTLPSEGRLSALQSLSEGHPVSKDEIKPALAFDPGFDKWIGQWEMIVNHYDAKKKHWSATLRQ